MNYFETGHDKNIANFEDLISRCTGFGAPYNPSLNAIKIANMNTLRTNCLNAMASLYTTKTALTNAVNNRNAVFDPLHTFATRVMSALKACGVSDAIIKDATTINRKIQGQRAKAIEEETNLQLQKNIDPNEPPVEQPKNISVSQLSFDSMIEHYSKLINLLASIPAYNPNENELKVSGLNTLLASMKAVNTAVITATTNVMNARINRNNLLYKKPSGLFDVAMECKSYVKSVFGSKSAEYKQVSSIQFKRLIKV